ncbi:dienelactone hydrolase family protein [Citrobacter sp. Cb021]|uniref:dienelactone hydrolase family protein n=1 Tax=Citrobacter sp. Cb021 TaxID=2985018 RepID=UPI00258095BF|nr:dienelactone hydrolase family protein [Citrobacter sp. Cb021]MDM3418529.1 dienelactone hydrolase family protein [Citrobacter sp. Cb021]
MYTLLSKNENAVIVLHEIYGLNNHIKQVCKELHNTGLDVYCPNFLNREVPFSYDQHSQAYDYFMKFCGFDTSMIFDLLIRIRDHYKKIIIVGFSVGGTLAWLCSENTHCDGIVSFYGSRIRDYTDIMPNSPTLVIQAKYEEAYDPYFLQHKLRQYPLVSFHILNSRHGFCDPYNKAYNPPESAKALTLSHDFITKIIN